MRQPLMGAPTDSATLHRRGGVVEEEEVKISNSMNLVVAALVVALSYAPAAARESNSKEASTDFGIGAVTVLANVVYMPVKLGYGLLGGLTGCFAYVFSGANRDVAEGVWVPSLGGDYVLTTEMMSGREHVQFNGVRERSALAAYDEPSEDDDGTF
ncbi:MAG: hypothetical protein ABR587_11210 [Candidatus Binatia bacterium]